MIIVSDSLTPQVLNVYSMPGCGPGLGFLDRIGLTGYILGFFNGVSPCVCMHKFIPHESDFVKT